MKILVYGIKDYVHYWTYVAFKELHNAQLLDFKTNGNLIEYVIYDIKSQNIDIKFLKESDLSYESEI